MSAEVLARIDPNQPRRWFALGVMYALSGLLIILAVFYQPTLAYQGILLAMAVLVLFGADNLRKSTARSLILTEYELKDSAGQILARVEDVERVERGAFAFKPSNGFLVTTGKRGSRYWAPGLWWRLGRRVGVGGTTSAGQAKAMADILASVVAQRDTKR